jgi:hypothetical protein
MNSSMSASAMASFRLLGHLGQNALLRARLESAGVHHQVGALAEPAVAVVAVARQPRKIRHQRVARPRQAIEQGGLADVGPADDDQRGRHAS